MKAKRVFVCAGMLVFSVLTSLILYPGKAAPIEIPPEVQKKAVSLKQANADAERSYKTECGKCHKAPDPAGPDEAKPECVRGLNSVHLEEVRHYLSNVRAGKSLYGSYCGRCHTLIDPGSHTFDYWSKNICTSDSCMVKRRLTKDEEQQLLLYLSSHAGND
jgi:mono/diheme cytochrome c family protein